MTIPVSSETQKRALLALEERLEHEGVAFDASWDHEDLTRDWELDWSLEGELSPDELIDRLSRTGFAVRVKWRTRQD